MYTRIKIYQIYFLLSVLIFSCAKVDTTKRETSLANAPVDSISYYMRLTQNDSVSTSLRSTLFNKTLFFINKLSEDSLKIKYLNDLSYKSISREDSLFFRKVNHQTITLATKLNDSAALAEAKWDLGIFLKDTGLKDSTYFYYNQAFAIYSKLKNESKKAYLLRSIATTQTALGDYSGAELNIIKALEIFKTLKDNKGLYLGYNSLGNISNSLNEYHRAIEFYNTASEYLDSITSTESNRVSIINNIGVSYNYLENFEKAEQNFMEVVNSDSLKYKDPSFYAKALTNLANTKSELKRQEDLTPLFREAIEIQHEENNMFSEAMAISYYAKYLSDKGDHINAIAEAKKAVKLAAASKNTEALLRTLDLLTLVDKPNASAYAQEYIAVNEKLQKDERTLRDKFARVRFQTDEVVEKNDLLANQNKLLTREKQLWSAISAIGLVAAIAVIVIISQRIRTQRIRNRKLKFKQQQQESNQEIFNLLMTQQGKLEEGKKIEQERISQELHDGVLNKMLGIRLVLTGLNKKTDQEAIDQRAELIKELAELSEEIRTVSHELSNAAYQNVYNFMESIKVLVETFRRATPEVNFNFAYTQDFGWDDLIGDTKINLYRIVQESIQNCTKHALATTIFINFEATGKEIIVSIEDNGKGFESKKAKKGIGFRNISSRVNKMNGDWDLSTTLGEGTTITVKVPLTLIKEQVA